MEVAKMQLTDWLDDLSVRFIVNLPREELESVERICFQVEEAQWFYEDFVRPLDPNLPSLSLRQFSMKIFQHCPLFSSFGAEAHSKAFSEFLAYKTRVPVRGAILLNEALDQVILVKGWKKGANWSFPRGKINKDEKDIDCATREVYEETGFDVRAAGLVQAEQNAKYIEVTMREQHMKLYVFAGVPMSTHFEPRTRKEISKIQWYKLSDLPTLKKVKHQQHGANDALNNPNKFYMVAPFLNPLRRIISSLRRERLGAHVSTIRGNTLSSEAFDSPEQVPQQLHDSAPVEGDMDRLVSKLRQSQSATQDDACPIIHDPTGDTRLASLQLKSLLNLEPEGESGFPHQYKDVTSRESKAIAMLSLLREGDQNVQTQPWPKRQPQTPLEQITSELSQPPPSPKQQMTQTLRPTSLLQPRNGLYSSSLLHTSEAPERQPLQPSLFRGQQYNQPLGSHSLPNNLLPPRLSTQIQLPASTPYRRKEDLGPVQTPDIIREIEHSAPAASKLPPPKLNQHSTTLLSLFKTHVPAVPHTNPKALSTDNGAARQELSVPSPTSLQQPTFTSPGHSQLLSSTPALASPASKAARGQIYQRSPQQEALLGLFRQSKPSPSLVPPDAPVELSAQGSPTQSRVPSVDDQPNSGSKLEYNGRTPATSLIQPTRSTNTSATVTGPLNVPQFEKILRRPKEDKISKPVNTNSAPIPESPFDLQRPVKILSRPPASIDTKSRSSNTRITSSDQAPLPELSKQTESRQEPKTVFHPQILKRTKPAPPSSGDTSPRTGLDTTIEVPPRMPASQPATTAVIDRRSSQSQEQKSALLALFGKQRDPIASPMLGRSTSVVSPLSERPPAGSELPSPLGLERSRLGSLQDGISLKDVGRSSNSNPGDKKFLLGFLDGVVKDGRR